jgi:hypothetical protein
MKKYIFLSIILLFLITGCATVDTNVPKEKGLWNTLLFVGIIVGGAAIAANTLDPTNN